MPQGEKRVLNEKSTSVASAPFHAAANSFLPHGNAIVLKTVGVQFEVDGVCSLSTRPSGSSRAACSAAARSTSRLPDQAPSACQPAAINWSRHESRVRAVAQASTSRDLDQKRWNCRQPQARSARRQYAAPRRLVA